MNETVNTFLLAGDKCMPEMHLNEMLTIYKSKERIQKFKETGDSRYIYQKELDRACFQHDMPYGDFKDLTKRTASEKILCDKAFNIAKNPKYDELKGVLLQWFIYFLIKSLLLVPLFLHGRTP